VRRRKLTFLGQPDERTQPAAARFDGEAAFGSARLGNDEVLKEAPGLDIGLQLKVGLLIDDSAHVAR
jgi:hypothetical protein